MADYDQRPRGGRGGYNNRKRRYRDEEDYNHRPQRRRYEEPLSSRIRKQLLSLAESPLKRVEEEIVSIAKTICEHYSDTELLRSFYDLVLQLVLEQPFKTPFLAAVVVWCNTERKEVAAEVLERTGERLEKALRIGEWREVKLYLKFLGGLQGLLEGEGVFALLQDLLTKAVELQTETNEEMIGPEMVKIILLTLPYIMASSATNMEQKAAGMIENTDIIASEPHVLQALVDPFPGNGKEEAEAPNGVLGLLQKQLQKEMENGWELACLPRPWKAYREAEQQDPLAIAPKHALPTINVPETVYTGPRPLFPELYFSVYANQDIETVPQTTNIASCLLRDALIDTISILDFNRNATARFLIDVDCYFAPGTFVKRATPFDRLRDIEGDRSTWKPEDVAVDAVFSQLFQLPAPEHKLVYYHSVLTEACKIAPAAIAPSLGRAIRYLYRNVDSMDLELSYRFMDWFAHHLSNFGFTWKWTEWVDDVELPNWDPKKAFIQGALDKEIRLSFAQRIKGTLPAPYQQLISEEKEKDAPDFKYNDPTTPFSVTALEIHTLLRQKAPHTDILPLLTSIQETAQTQHSQSDPILPSTDAHITSLCFIGSKSLSHMLSCIERHKDYLLTLGSTSSSVRRQIITSVMQYWAPHPGIGVNIVDKLLNYTILSPGSVIEWALASDSSNLALPHVFEMVWLTVSKVVGRVRQVLSPLSPSGSSDEEKQAIEQARKGMQELHTLMDDYLSSWASGAKDQSIQDGMGDSEETAIRQWGGRWARAFTRRFAVEESWGLEIGRERERERLLLVQEEEAKERDMERERREREKERERGMQVDGNGTSNGGVVGGNGVGVVETGTESMDVYEEIS